MKFNVGDTIKFNYSNNGHTAIVEGKVYNVEDYLYVAGIQVYSPRGFVPVCIGDVEVTNAAVTKENILVYVQYKYQETVSKLIDEYVEQQNG